MSIDRLMNTNDTLLCCGFSNDNNDDDVSDNGIQCSEKNNNKKRETETFFATIFFCDLGFEKLWEIPRYSNVEFFVAVGKFTK